jgi:hypothetical protein
VLRAQIFILSLGDHLLLLEYIYTADKSSGVNAGAIYHVWFLASNIAQDLDFCSSKEWPIEANTKVC